MTRKSLELCWAIEDLPASEQQTALAVLASEVDDEIKRLRAALSQLVFEVKHNDCNIDADILGSAELILQRKD